MENIINTYQQIIEAQKERQLTGEEFIQLRELQALTKVLNSLEKEYRDVVDKRMSI